MESYLIEVRPVGLSEVELLLLSEPAKLRFYHFLLSAERRQVEEVKPFAGVTCGGKKHREHFSENRGFDSEMQLVSIFFFTATACQSAQLRILLNICAIMTHSIELYLMLSRCQMLASVWYTSSYLSNSTGYNHA